MSTNRTTDNIYATGIIDLTSGSGVSYQIAGESVLAYNTTGDNLSLGPTGMSVSALIADRPNNIGISVVKLSNIKENVIEIENVDILNGTPLLDIKPYIPEFDIHEIENKGWAKDVAEKIQNIKSDKRFK